MQSYRASRLIAAEYKSSTLPVLLETDGGTFFVKLVGTAQGVPLLIAEIIVANIAEALGLRVPERVLVYFDKTLTVEDKRDELGDLLRASYGWNLGFTLLKGARNFREDDHAHISDTLAATILWLDGFTMNPDRTARNPNIMVQNGAYWLIDHGSALPFQYQWSGVKEDSPPKAASFLANHLFRDRLQHLSAVDESLASVLTRETLERAIQDVPDDFLRRTLPKAATVDEIQRRRNAYSAYLWKRLKAPRTFALGYDLLSESSLK